jgi:hypothetical protein
LWADPHRNDDSFGYTFSVQDEPPYYWHCYPTTNDLWSLWVGWREVANAQQDTSLHSGILADWLEDHRDELLSGATGPTDPAARLDALIDYLRSRFRQQFEGVQ